MTKPTVNSDSVAQDQIRAFVERVERLHEERTAIGKNISEVFAEAKGNGFDIKALKIVIGKRRQDQSDRMELEALVELYEAALGMRAVPWDIEEDGVPGRRAAVGTPRATRALAHEKSEPAERPAAVVEANPLDIAEEADGARVEPASSAPIQPETAGDHQASDSDPAAAGGKPDPAVRSDNRSGPEGSSDDVGGGYASELPESTPAPQVVVASLPSPADKSGSEAGAELPAPSNMQNQHNAPGSIVMERTPPEGVIWHDVLTCFPEKQGRAWADFLEDVRANGVREPIIRSGRFILDGRSRFLAARELRIEYPVQEYAGDDPVADIVAFNLEARGLDLVERIRIAKKVAKLLPVYAARIEEMFDLDQQREAAE